MDWFEVETPCLLAHLMAQNHQRIIIFTITVNVYCEKHSL